MDIHDDFGTSKEETHKYHLNETEESDSESAPLVLESFQLEDLKPLSRKQETVGHLQFLTLCWFMFLFGWNDGSIGPLLPRIQANYEVGFATVSWIFALSCVGVIIGALINMPLNRRFGFGKMIFAGSLFQISAFIMQSLALPFPIFVSSYLLGGIGIAFQDAQSNGFVALVKHGASYKMGVLHASYGVGALISPVSATHFSQATHWSYHYLISVIFALCNAASIAWVFRFRSQDDCLAEAGEIIPEKTDDEGSGSFSEMMKIKAVHLLAIFTLVYIGVEVTIGGWIVTYMMLAREGGAFSGYVASGFFAGLTLGRVVLLWVNKKIGEVNAVYIYTIFSISLQLVVWLVPSIITGSIAIFFIGLVLGPLYPISMNHTSRVVPRDLVVGAVGWVAASGAAGNALLPVFGQIASVYGIGSLQPFLVGIMLVMGFLWYLVPKMAIHS